MSAIPREQLTAWLRNLNETHFRELVMTYLAQSPTQRQKLLARIAVYDEEDDDDNLFEQLLERLIALIKRPEKSPYYKLAETILLFTETFETSADPGKAIRHANQHYIINTDGRIPLHEGDDHFDVFAWAKEYASNMMSIVLDADDANSITYMTIEDPQLPYICAAWGNVVGQSCARTLRDIARLINETRYERQDIMPTHLFPLEPEADDYRKHNAVWMAQFSSIAYLTPWYTEKEMQRLGFNKHHWIENPADTDHDTQAFAASNADCIILAFRGSEHKTDWLNNFDLIRQVSITIDVEEFGNVHHGFWGALESVWDQVRNAVDDLGSEKPIFITGHSLGGALAKLAGLRLSALDLNIAGIYTFGAPRIGDSKFAMSYMHWLGDKIFMHVNSQDAIPHLPPWVLGYQHVSQKIRRFDIGHNLILDGQNSIFHQALDKQQTQAISDRLAELERQEAQPKSRDLKAKLADSDSYAPVTRISEGVVRIKSDHAASDYLFKLACAIMEERLDAMAW